MSDLYAANPLGTADAVSAASLSPSEPASGAALASGGGAASGFDVNAAAAEVWSTSSPGAAAVPAQQWTAVDYGWDPADANAVAWAAYYSEQGLDPAAVAAQQAAEVAAEPAPVQELSLEAPQPEAFPPLDLAEPVADPAPLPEAERAEPLPDSPPLPELDFVRAAEAPPVPAEVPAADFEAAASSLWDLLPAPDAVEPAVEQQAPFPGGWPGDDAAAHLDELHLAGGGSFDEATAPIADLSPEQLVEAYPPGVDLSPEPEELEPLGPLPASLAPPGSSDALPPIDLGALGLEPEVSIDLDFVDDEPARAAPGEALAAAARPSEPPPAPEMDWAAELAVPAGDGAIDLASFEAPPQPDEQPAARDRTAMWGLAGSQGAGAAKPAFAVPALQDDPWDAEASHEAAGGPLQPSIDLEPAEGFGPFDLGAPEPAVPEPGVEPMPLAFLELPSAEPSAEPEVMETTEEQILEVGEEVVEVAPAGEPQLRVPAVMEPAVAPLVEARPAAQPEPFFAPPEPAVAVAATAPVAKPAAASEPAPASSSYIAGPHRVVIHTADGQVKRGTVSDVALDGPELLLQPQAGGAAEKLPAERVKAIFFMLATGEAPPEPAGKKVRVTFRDGRQVAGFSPDYLPERAGFFMIPVDTRTHTARIWVYRTSVRQVTIS